MTWLKTLYNNSKCKTINNGAFSEIVYLRRKSASYLLKPNNDKSIIMCIGSLKNVHLSPLPNLFVKYSKLIYFKLQYLQSTVDVYMGNILMSSPTQQLIRNN